MEIVLRRRNLALAHAVPTFFIGKLFHKLRPKEPYDVVWWILAFVVSISCLPQSIREASPFFTVVLTVVGAAGCAWIWLLARALFRPKNQIEAWNFGALAVIVAIEATARLAPTLAASGVNGEFLRLVSNAEPVVCISAIAFVFVEALSGYGDRVRLSEKRFRQIFMVVFGVVIVVAIVWGSNVDDTIYGAEWAERVSIASGLIALLGTRLAVEFRRRHPLPAIDARSASKSSTIRVKDQALARRILLTIEDETFFTRADLKLTDMATGLGVQDYLVTQCITGDLGFRNFNHLINTYRVKHAKLQLSDPGNCQKNISSIAFDCGFNSIGTFNRTFKKEVGVTPREFRASMTEDQQKLATELLP